MFCNPGFDQSPPGRIVIISHRKGPDTVEMVGQDDHGVDHKRAIGVDVVKGLAHQLNGLLITEQLSPSCGDDGEEVSAAGYERRSILHGVGLNAVGLRPRLTRPTARDYCSRQGFTRRPVMLPLGPRLFTKVPERS